MKTYVERFEAMVEEIKAHPWLEVVTFKVNPPASEQVFSDVEAKMKAPLAAHIRDFYSRANGLRLHWKIKSDLSDEEWEKVAEASDDYSIENSDDEDIPFASINLIPLEESIITGHWQSLKLDYPERQFEFQGKTYGHNEFAKRLRPFDVFTTYNCMAFVLEEGNGDPPAMLLGDYYIEWDNSRLTDFNSYLEMLLATRGISGARARIYGEDNGDLQPPLRTGTDYWTEERVPNLFKKQK
jgi:hypothetical protein